MNTPPTGVPHPRCAADLEVGVMSKALSARLEKVAKGREEATPESESSDDTDECYQWRCEELRHHFNPDEADERRMRISQSEYWELECLHYKREMEELMWRKAGARGVEGEPTAHHWRTLAGFYRDLFRKIGLSSAQTGRIRHSIKDQKYWKYEAELYQQAVALQEDKLQEELRARDEMKHLQIQRRQAAAQRARRTKRPQAANGSVASRTRSSTKASSRAAVAKRVGGVGAKAARSS